MPFPIIPVVAVAGLAGLGLLLFGEKEAKAAPTPAPAPRPAPAPAPKPQVVVEPPRFVPVTPPIVPPFVPGVLPQIAPQQVLPPSPTALPLPQVPIIPAPAPAPVPTPQIPSFPIPQVIVPPTPIAPSSLTAVAIGNPGTNIRSVPDTKGVVLEGVFNGKRVTILDPVPAPPTLGAPLGWLKVRSEKGTTGFASVEFLRPDVPGTVPIPSGPTPSAITPVSPTTNVIIPGPGTATVLGNPGANLRSQPNTSGALIEGVFAGTRVRLAEAGPPSPPTPGAPKGWFKVTTPKGNTGFMSAEFLRFDAGSLITGERMFTPGREGNLRRRNNISG